MNEIAIVKKQVQKAEWAERIRKCSESGLTVSEWCTFLLYIHRENGINLKTYYYHLRKLRKEICEQIPVPVMTVFKESHSVKISIGEVTAEIPEGINEQMMTTLIRAMKNA